MRVVQVKSPNKIRINTEVIDRKFKEIFDVAKLHKSDQNMIKELFIKHYELHGKVLVELVTARIALTSAIEFTERGIAQAMSHGNTPPVQISDEATANMLDAIYARALREYAINASAKIAIEDEELRKNYVNTYVAKSATTSRPVVPQELGLRKTQEDAQREAQHSRGIQRISKELENQLGPSDDNVGPYGVIEKEGNGKLPIVRHSVKQRLPRKPVK